MMDQDFLNKFSIKDVVNQGLPVWVHLVETAITANIKSKLSIAPYWIHFLATFSNTQHVLIYLAVQTTSLRNFFQRT